MATPGVKLVAEKGTYFLPYIFSALIKKRNFLHKFFDFIFSFDEKQFAQSDLINYTIFWKILGI